MVSIMCIRSWVMLFFIVVLDMVMVVVGNLESVGLVLNEVVVVVVLVMVGLVVLVVDWVLVVVVVMLGVYVWDF